MGWQINKIALNGECLHNAIQENHSIELSDKNLLQKLFQEIKNRSGLFLQFTQDNTEMQMLQEIHKCLSRKKDTYILPNVDLIIGAACNSLNINIHILQKYEGSVKEIRMIPEAHPSIATIYLLFTQKENRLWIPKILQPIMIVLFFRKQTPSTQSTANTNVKSTHHAQGGVLNSTNFDCFCHEKNLNAAHPKEKFEIDMSVFNYHA